MRFETHTYKEEVWGAMLPVEECNLEEEEVDEVFNILKKMIENEGMDTIPETIEVTAHDRNYNELDFEIDVDEWITKKQKKELQNLIDSYVE
jgi:F0F1-type ATP synthase delta subunit